jgi:thioredoxin 1
MDGICGSELCVLNDDASVALAVLLESMVMKRRSLLAAVLSAAGVTASVAAVLPYDESADAKADISRVLREAKADHRKVLVIFGANWCEDCRALDKALKTGPNAKLMSREFEVVKVDVGRFNRNLDVDAAYGNAIKKGIPAAVVLSADNQILYSTKAGELSNARRMSETGVYEFFDNVARKVSPQGQ